MAFDEKKFVGADALSELSTKVKTELGKKTDKAGALTNVSYDTTNKKLTKTTQGAHDPVITDIVTTATLKTDMGIADFDGTFSSLKSKPTTISGYGITDAKVQNSTVTIGSNSVTALTQEDVSSTYDSSGTSPVDGKAIAAALGTLDIESVGGAGKYISAISETDGKISATAETMDSTPTSNSTKAVTSNGIYEYVNSSVATNTAYFIGTFDSVEELEAYSGIITNNDYAFVTSTDSSGNTLYNRYKYNGSTQTWSFEYALNNSSFTSAQWATIQSGLTSSDKTKLDGIQSGANKTIVDSAMSASSTNPVQNKVVNTALSGKQDTLTFDLTPIQGSTNPVTSAGIYTDQARQDTLEAQDRAALVEVVDKGAKNLLKLGFTHKSAGFQTSDMTADGNGIIVNGNRNTTTDVILVNDLVTNQSAMFDTRYTLPAGKYVIPSTGTSNLRYQAYCHDGTNYQSLGYTMTDPLEFEYTATLKEQYPFIAYRLWASRVSSFDNLTVYPMICTKAEWDISQAYEPYALPNPPITAKMIEDVDGGCKNLLNPKNAEGYSSQSNFPITKTTGVTYTLNPDYTITATSSTEVSNATLCRIPITLPVGCYYISGSPTGGSDSSYRVDLRYSGGNTPVPNSVDYGEGFILNLSESTAIDYCMRIAAGYNNKTVTFKPMICTLADWNISHKYVPYKQDITWGLGDKIPQNSDFDSYTIPGVYRVENSTDAATMLHCPITTDGGRLEVSIGDTSTEILHTYFSGNAEWRRSYNGTTWSDWVQILSTATLDEIPTANSTNAVMSGGVWTDQQRQETEIGVVANAGAKNDFDLEGKIDSAVSYHATATLSDGILSVSATGNWARTAVPYRFKKGTSTFSCTVSNYTKAGGTMVIRFAENADSTNPLCDGITIDKNGDVSTDITVAADTSGYIVYYLNATGTSYANSADFTQNMVRPEEITDPTFQQFARTNRDLTVLTDEDRSALIEIVDGGAKNVADMTKSTFTSNQKDGVTVTLSGDMITSTGTSGSATNQFHRILYDEGKLLIPAGTWIAALIGTGTDAFRIEVMSSSYSDLIKGAYGSALQFTIPSGDTVSYLRITQKTSTNCAGTFKLMITTHAAWKISQTYQPYRPSWQEMWDAIQALQSGGTRALTMQTEPEEQEER